MYCGWTTALRPAPGKKPDRRKCPSCQITLTLANTFHCTRCETDVCIKHRGEEDHACSSEVSVDSRNPEIFDMRHDYNAVYDDVSAGLPSYISAEDIPRDSDRRSGKLSRIVIALANLCHFRRRRPGFSQFSDLGVGYNDVEMREVRPFGRV